MNTSKFFLARMAALRGMLALVLLALAACVNSASGSAPNSPDLSISGNLTLKGSEPGAWWAVTDDQGRVWKITSPTPDQIATFQRAQNHRVRIEGQRQEKYLGFEQIKASRVTWAP